MKKIISLAVLAVVVLLAFSSCEEPIDKFKEETPDNKKLPNLTIKNESSYVLRDVKYSNISFSTSGSNLPVSAQATKQLKESKNTGYITFIRDDIGILCRTAIIISIDEEDDNFTFTNNTVVQELTNTDNQDTLDKINFISKISIQKEGLSLQKNEVVSLGECNINHPLITEFIIKNEGVGKLLFTGSTPIKITGAGVDNFSVTQPTSKEVAPDDSIAVKVSFFPLEDKIYTATVTISTNDKEGDFVFYINARGVPPKPIARVYYNDHEIIQDGTVDAGEVLITQSKELMIVIKNTGDTSLTINSSNINITGSNASSYSRLSTPGSIVSADGQTSFRIECKPIIEGVNEAILEILTNDNSRNPIIIHLKTMGIKGNAVIELSQAGKILENNTLTAQIDYGRLEISTFTTLTFTIKNSGNINLNLPATPNPVVSSSNSAFVVQLQPSNRIIAPGLSATFILRFQPNAEAEVTGIINIENDSDEGIFSFSVKGTGYRKRPQIEIIYNNTAIAQNNTIDTGEVLITQSKNINVTIKNSGEEVLKINPETITITGTNAAAFSMQTFPSANISAAGGQSSFNIKCEPVIEGENTAILTIPSDDINRNPAIVYLKTTGVKGAAVFELSQGSTVIADKSITPFDFGQITVGSGASQIYTFTIKNTGNINLNLTGNPLVQSNNSTFAVQTQPSNTSITPGNTTSFLLRYTPTSEKVDNASITIENNSKTELFTLYVKGNGYVQKPAAKVFYNTVEVAQNGTIDTGETLITQSKIISVTIRNNGDAILNMSASDITITGTDAAAFIKNTNPNVSIQPDSSTSFNIEFKPTKQGENNAVLSIPTNDNSRNPIIINLKGTGIKGNAIPTVTQGSLSIQNNLSTPINFGKTLVGSSTVLPFTIKNTGNINLELNGNPVIKSSNNTFTVQTQPTNITIAPGNEIVFNLRYTPTAENEDSATISFLSNSETIPQYSFLVRGNGYLEMAQITLRQNTNTLNPNGEITFGSVAVGEYADLIFTIGNTGDANLIAINNWVNIGNNELGIFNVQTQPASQTVILPGNTSTFTIRYSPKTIGDNFSATIQIITNSRDNSVFAFTVKGSSFERKSKIAVLQGTTSINNNGEYTYSSVVAGAGRYRDVTFTIRNIGDANLTFVNNAEKIKITSNSGNIFTVNQQPSLSVITPTSPNNSTTFIVRFMPTTAGNNFTATVQIESNSGENPLFSFVVKGSATAPSTESRLSNLQTNRGKLSPVFHSDIKSYTLMIDSSVNIVNFTPISSSSNITGLTVNGVSRNSGALSQDIILVSTNTVTIIVTAEDGITYSTYVISIERKQNYSNTNISSLYVSNMDNTDTEDVLGIMENSTIGWYAMPGETQLKFNITPINPNATVRINNNIITNGVYTSGYNLNSGSNVTVFTITITSEEGNNTQTFYIESAYFGSQWQRVSFLPSQMNYYPVGNAVWHNNQLIYVNIDQIAMSSNLSNWNYTTNLSNIINNEQGTTVILGNTIYNIGGYAETTPDNWEISSGISFSTNGTNWTKGTNVTGLTNGIAQHTSVVFNNYIYTMGGETRTASETNTIWRSNNGTAWTQVTPSGTTWGARAGHASVVYNGNMYVMGGAYNKGNSEYRDVWRTSNGTNWTQVTSTAQWSGRNDHTVNANSMGMWLVGGNDGFFKNDVWFSRDGSTWISVLENAPFQGRALHSAVIINGWLYIMGGVNNNWDNPIPLYDIWATYIGE